MEDLSNLLGDLQEIGIKHTLVEGEDYLLIDSFENDCIEPMENNGENVLVLTEFGAKCLERNLIKDFGTNVLTSIPTGYSREKKPFPYWTDKKLEISSGGSYGYQHEFVGNILKIGENSFAKIFKGSEKTKFTHYIKLRSHYRFFPVLSRWDSAKNLSKRKVKVAYKGLIKYLEKTEAY